MKSTHIFLLAIILLTVLVSKLMLCSLMSKGSHGRELHSTLLGYNKYSSNNRFSGAWELPGGASSRIVYDLRGRVVKNSATNSDRPHFSYRIISDMQKQFLAGKMGRAFLQIGPRGMDSLLHQNSSGNVQPFRANK